MIALVIQTLLLMVAAYILGCILGCLLHQWFGEAPVEKVAAPIAPLIPTPAPVPKPKLTPKLTPKADPDDLKQIKGIGRQNEARLNAIDITQFAQIAVWSKKEQADMGERLAFPGRIEREEWVKQAAVLAKGGQTQFSKRVAKGQVSSSSGKGSVGNLGKKPSTIAKASGGKPDNLTLIDGVGNALEKKLFALGIYHFDQVAKWSKDNEAWIGNELGFPGRPERENWVKESKILGAGGTTDHSNRVEAGKIKSSRKSKK
ncbi:MAG: hypothetical protein COC00_004375 [Rhizobiales bacterium]|nr:hypothetical protein [Hyphomicrobiales bacterium]